MIWHLLLLWITRHILIFIAEGQEKEVPLNAWNGPAVEFIKEHQGSQEFTFKSLKIYSESHTVSLSQQHSLTHRNDQPMSSPMDGGEMSQREDTTYRLLFPQLPSVARSSVITPCLSDFIYTCSSGKITIILFFPTSCNFMWMPSGLNANVSTVTGVFPKPCSRQVGISSICRWEPSWVCPRDSSNVVCSTPNHQLCPSLFPVYFSHNHKRVTVI